MVKDGILELKKEGFTQKEIVKELGCSKAMVSQYYSLDGCQKANTRKRRYAKLAKQHALTYLGGCCSKCGYDKAITALEFHHVNPSNKDFSISTFKSTNIIKLEKELDKCILLCANCHRELHEEESKYPNTVWRIADSATTSYRFTILKFSN